ncbi:MAG TPA: hypothetical protein VIF57_07020 [Polyangia bacterium]|jgi:hypothetical protein
MRRRSLPQVVIPVPCRVDWETMARIDGEGRARFCDSCERPVYDGKAMTRGELADLIARHEGRRLPCVRLHRRPDGTLVTRDCFASFLRAGRLLWAKVGLAAVAFWAWALGRPFGRSFDAYRAQREAAIAALDRTVVLGGGIQIIERRPERDGLAALPQSAARTHAIPDLGVRPMLSKVDRAAPLRYLEADESVRKRLEPDKFPSLKSRRFR